MHKSVSTKPCTIKLIIIIIILEEECRCAQVHRHMLHMIKVSIRRGVQVWTST
jgi:hypothetical protein